MVGGSGGVHSSFARNVQLVCLLVVWLVARLLRLAPPGAGVLVEVLRELATRGKSTSASGEGSGQGAGARVAVRSLLEDHETAILEVERQVELLEKRVRDFDTFAAAVDTMETRVQETQKVVAEFVINLDKSVRDLKKQWDSNFTELEDDLELRVEEIAKSMRDDSKELQVLARAVKNLEQRGDRDTNTGCSGWSRLCDHAVAVPAVRRVLRASCSVPRQNGGHSSCMQILVLTVQNCAADRGDVTGTVLGMVLDAPVVVQQQVPWLETLEFFRSCRSPGGRAMLGSMMDTCYASFTVAFGGIFMIFYMRELTRLLSSIHVLLFSL